MNKAKELIEEYQTSDPFEIAKAMGIEIFYSDLKEAAGFFQTVGDFKFIHLNSNLSYSEQIYTCAHELGHYVLHDNDNIHFLKHNTYYNTQKIELEADLFASYFIISDETIKELNSLPYIAINYKLDYRVCEERLKYLTL